MRKEAHPQLRPGVKMEPWLQILQTLQILRKTEQVYGNKSENADKTG